MLGLTPQTRKQIQTRLERNSADRRGLRPPAALLTQANGAEMLLHRTLPDRPETVEFHFVEQGRRMEGIGSINDLLASGRSILPSGTPHSCRLLIQAATKSQSQGHIALYPSWTALTRAQLELAREDHPVPERMDRKPEPAVPYYAVRLKPGIAEQINQALLDNGHDPNDLLDDMAVFNWKYGQRTAWLGRDYRRLATAVNRFLEQTGNAPKLLAERPPFDHAAMFDFLELCANQFQIKRREDRTYYCHGSRFNREGHPWAEILKFYPNLPLEPLEEKSVAEQTGEHYQATRAAWEKKWDELTLETRSNFIKSFKRSQQKTAAEAAADPGPEPTRRATAGNMPAQCPRLDPGAPAQCPRLDPDGARHLHTRGGRRNPHCGS